MVNETTSHDNHNYLTEHEFFPRIVNKTNVSFNEDETKLLEKGLKYNITPPVNSYDLTLLDTESAIQTLPINIQDEVRYELARKINKTSSNPDIKNSSEIKISKSIRQKITDGNAVVTKADKGNTVVILDKTEYDTKIEHFLTVNKIQKLNSDPTSKYSKEINSTINTCKNIFPVEQRKRLKVTNPVAPKLRGLPKIHKDGAPMRPLVNAVDSPTYLVAKSINKMLNDNIHFDNTRSLKNSTDLIDKIKDVVIPSSAKLVSFDVKDLYTSIPVNEALNVIKDKLKNESFLPNENVEELVLITKTILKQNYFTYNGNFYHQNEGLAMGSPLSGTIANIYMSHIEEKLLMKENKHSEKIVYWYRYVDDVLALVNGSSRQIDILLKHINSYHPQIKFTLEIEQNKQINYLDLTIKNEENLHKFAIYRKATQSNMVIHKNSNHPRQQKFAAFRSMFYRLEKVPMCVKDYNDELKIIFSIATANGYSKQEITHIHNKVKNNVNKQKSPVQAVASNNSPNNIFVGIEYNKKLENILSNTFKKYDRTVAYKTSNKLQNKLRPVTDTLHDPFSGSGVYRINCSDCNKFYIGQTGRSFKTRFKEHIACLKNPEPKSKFAEHLIDTNHKFDNIDTNMQILHKSRKSRRLDRLEEIEIYRGHRMCRDDILNEKVGYKGHPLYDKTRLIGTEKSAVNRCLQDKQTADNSDVTTHTCPAIQSMHST